MVNSRTLGSVKSEEDLDPEDQRPFVSVIVPVYNEEKYIEACLRAIVEQEYPSNKIEVLVVDGMSEDRTREIVSQMSQGEPFWHLLDNPGRITSEAVNIGVQASSGKIIAIVGGHSVISPAYVAKAVSYLSRADRHIGGVGSTLENIAEGVFGNLVAHALSSPFGVGNSQFRFAKKVQFVDTIAYGAYARDVFDKVGLWDTGLVRNQDIEFNYRVRRAGWRLLLDPGMGCRYYCRSNILAFIKQNYGNGYWNILTFAQRPGSLSWRHFAPLAFVLGLLLANIAWVAEPWGWQLLVAIALPYFICALFVGAIHGIREREGRYLLLGLVFPLLHIGYGIGSLAGAAQLVFSKLLPKIRFKVGWLLG